MRLALRIEVTTDAGAREGVPALLCLLDEYQLQASFLVALGPDFSTYSLYKAIPSWLKRRLPVSYIGHRNRAVLQSLTEAGHEVGITGFTPTEWLGQAAFKSREWLEQEVVRALDSFQDLYGVNPTFYGATGWQINPHLLALEGELGFRFATDVRGKYPFLPELQGVRSSCVQIPTTLPTLLELLKCKEVNAQNLHQYLFAASQRVLPMGEVFSISAEAEGRDLLDVLERLLVMWRGANWEFRTLGEIYIETMGVSLKRHSIGWDRVEGAEHYQAAQGTEQLV